MQQDQDLHGMNMETEYDHDWQAAQHQDELLEQQEIAEAIDRIYKLIDELEAVYSCKLPTQRADVRFIELTLRNKYGI